jgi:phage I-like protein
MDVITQTIEPVACAAGVTVGTGLKTVRLSPWGEVKSKMGTFLLDAEAATAIVDGFLAHETPLVIDYEHATLGGKHAAPHGRAPAAGWITKLWAEAGKGMFGLVEWTDKAREAIQKREYAYLSPVLSVRKADGRAVALHSVGLTNVPAIPAMDRLAAKNTPTEEQVMADDKPSDGMNDSERAAFDLQVELLTKIKKVLDMDGDPSPQAVLEAALEKLESLLGEGKEDEQENRAIVAAVRERLGLTDDAGKAEIILCMTTRDTGNAATELAVMREAEADRVAKERVDKYVKGNVINPNDKAQMSAAMSLAKENPERFEALLANAPPYVQPGKTEPPSDRQMLIMRARSDYTHDPQMQKTCSCEAAINLALREAGFESMSDEETRVYVTRV